MLVIAFTETKNQGRWGSKCGVKLACLIFPRFEHRYDKESD
jgi:hypothetical protein